MERANIAAHVRCLQPQRKGESAGRANAPASSQAVTHPEHVWHVDALVTQSLENPKGLEVDTHAFGAAQKSPRRELNGFIRDVISQMIEHILLTPSVRKLTKVARNDQPS